MASNYQDILDEYARIAASNAASVNATGPIDSPVDRVTEASQRNQQRISQISSHTGYRVAVGQDSDLPLGSEVEQDIASLSPSQLYSKYGSQAAGMIAAKVSGRMDYSRDQSTPGTGVAGTIGNSLGDAFNGANSLISGFLTLGGLGVDALTHSRFAPKGYGTNFARDISDASNDLSDGIHGAQSEGLQAARRVADAKAALRYEENNRLADKQRADGTLLPELRRYGRGFLNAFKNAGSSGETLASDAISSAVSMFAVGPESKLISRAAGPLTRYAGEKAIQYGIVDPANKLLPRLAEAAPTVLSIASQEGTGAVQDIVSQLNQVSHADLMQGSPEYRQLIKSGVDPEEAKREIISHAALEAGGIQSVIGGAAGTIVHKIEGGSVLRNLAEHGVLRSAGKEFLEEGIQNTGTGLSENLAIRDHADTSRPMGLGVGEMAGQGAILGALSAGVLAAPGSLTHHGLGAAQAAGRTALEGAKALAQPFINRGSDLMQAAADRSPISLKSMSAAADIVMSKAPQVVASIRDAISRAPDADIAPEDKAKAGNYIQRLMGRINVDPSEVASMPVVDAVKQKIGEVANRFDLISKLANLVQDKSIPDEAKVDAAIQLHHQIQGNEDVIGQGEHLYDTLDKLPAEDHSATPELLRFNQLMTRIKDVPVVKSALDGISSLLARAKLTPGDTSPENISRAVGVAEIAPEHMDPDVADTILMHEEKAGNGTMTPEQIALLKAARDLARANAEHQATAADLKSGPSVVTDQIRTDQTGKNDKQPSALGHYKIITDAMRRGDTETAKNQLQKLVNFGQTLQNKVGALNTHLAKGDGTQNTGVPYQNFTASGVWRPSLTKASVNPTVPSTIDYAQRVHNDARAVTSVANGLIKAYPQLGFKPMSQAELHPELHGNPVQTARANAKLKAQGHQFGQKVSNTARAPLTTVEQYIGRYTQGEQDQPDMKQFAATHAKEIEAYFTKLNNESRARDAKPPVKMKVSEMLKASETEAQLREQDAQPELGLPEPQAKPATTNTKTTATGEETPVTVVPEAPLEAPVAVDKSVEAKTRTDGLKGYFAEAFTVPAEPKSRLVSLDRPVQAIRDAFASPEKFEEFLGGKARGNFTPEIAAQYQYILDQTKIMAQALNRQLRERLNKVVDGKTIEQHILDGTRPNRKDDEGSYDPLRMIDSKALNLTREVDGKLEYDPNLLGSAILAGVNWTLTAGRYWSKIDLEKAADILDIPEANARQFLEELRKGLGLIETKQSLANMIQQFWGVKTNRDTDEALSRGIAESMAGEILHAMEEAELIGISKFRVLKSDGLKGEKPFQDYQRFAPLRLGDDDPVRAYTSAIEEAVLPDHEPEYHVGEAPKVPAKTQMNNPRVENTADTRSAIDHENKTPYFANVPLITFYQTLDVKGMTRLFGEPDLDKRKLNLEHKKTLEGRNQTLTSAVDTIGRLTSQIENRAEATGKSVEETPVFFAHNASKVGRMQQLGKDNPQANKTTRTVYLPMKSTLDLVDRGSEDFSRYGLGLAQALGIKVHQISRVEALKQVFTDLEGKYAPAVELLSQWHEKPFKPSNDDIDTIRKAAGGEIGEEKFHALFDYARFKNADEKARKAYSTQLYVEADGVANGISNAMLMTANGMFDAHQLDMMTKSGVFVVNPTQTMNDHRAVDDVDTYKQISRRVNKAVADRIVNEDGISQRQLTNITDLLELFDAGASKTMNQETGTVDVSYDRDLVKNPATITLYGSGEKGIAGNLVGTLLDNVYEQMSKAAEKKAANPAMTTAEAMFGDRASPVQTAQQIYDLFRQQMAELQSPATALSKGVDPIPEVDLIKFKVSDNGFENMQKNMHELFVKPLRAAISETIGDSVMDAMDGIRTTGQVQGIFRKYKYQELYAEAMKGKAAGEGLSPKEQDALFEAVDKFAPIVDAGSQRFDPSGSSKSSVKGQEFGRSLSGKFRTDAYTVTPENPGVRAMPMMIIGRGDGYAMQAMASMKNAVQQTLKIFDGVNMALHLMEEGSRQANQAAFQAMMNNPVADVLKSYKAMMANADFENMGTDQRQELIDSLFGLGKKAEKITNAEIKARAVAELQSMEVMSRSIEARHNVLKKTSLSVDQMAAVGEPHLQTGSIDLTGMTHEEAARTLNKAYAAEYARLTQEAADAAPGPAGEGSEEARTRNGLEGNIAEEIQRVSQDGGNGVRTINHGQLKRLLKDLSIPGAQKTMLNEIVQSLTTKGYRIVAGTMDSIRSWSNENGLKGVPLRGGTVQGYISFADRVIYSTNATSETLTHELIHAATFENLVAYYKDGTNGKNIPEVQAEAIKRIEALAHQFVKLGKVQDAVPVSAETAYANAVAAMDEQSRKGTAVGKAAALNEFMAWALSNEKLNAVLAKQQATPFARLTKVVMDAIKKVIWGNRAGLSAASDMLSNLQFNTGILINEAPSVKELVGDTGLFQHEAYGRNQRLAEMTETFDRKLTDFLSLPTDVRQQQDHGRRHADAIMMAKEVADVMRDHFPMDMQEYGLHQMVVAALATQAKLDPNALDEVAKLYEHVVKHITPESFMPESSADPDVDRHYAQLKYDAIVGNLGGQKDTYGRSTLMSNFLALSMVNEDFRKVLRGVPVPKLMLNAWDSIDHAGENAGMYLMDRLGKFAAGADRNAPNVEAALGALTDHILEVAQDRTSAMDALVYKGHGIVDYTNEKFNEGKDKVVGGIIDKANKLQERTNNKLANYSLEAVKAVSSFLSEKHGAEQGQSFMRMINSMKALPTFMHEVANEMIGRTKDNASIYDMIKLVRARVQQLRQQFREEVPEILANRFTRKLKKEEWTHLFKGLAKTDLAALKDMSLEQVVDLLKDQSSVANHISSAEEQVSSLAGSNSKLIMKKAKQLAEFMNTGRAGHRLLSNARAVASLHGEGVHQPGKANPSKALIEAVDHLTSLYALDGLSRETKVNLAEMAKTEGDGMAFALSYLQRMRNDELEKVSRSDYALENHFKGYIPSEAALGAGLTVGNVDNEKALLARGYRKIGNYTGSKAELNKANEAYYFSPVSGRGMFNAGILQNVRATASGVDPHTGYSNSLSTAGVITDPGDVNTITRRLARGDNAVEALRPVYNAAGETIAYERMMDPIHDARLNRNTNLAEMIGAWHGRQIEEEQGRVFNRVLGLRLKNMWERDKTLRADEYVNIFSKDVKDPIVRDAVSLMSSETRDHIESLFGKKQMWVRRDMLNDVIGYRNASIGDSWNGISRWPPATQEAFKKIATAVFGDNAYRYLMTAERTWQNLVTDAKVLIVIKSIIVPMANLADNFFQLLSRGVPINDIIRGMVKHTANVQSYMDSRKRLIEAQAELHAAQGNIDTEKKLKAEIQTIEDGHKRLAIWPLIAAGEFSAISDVGISHEQLTLSEGRLSEYMERLTDKLPPAVHTLGRYAIVSRDTALFKGLQRATEYGDFLAKAVLYEHLLEKKGQSHEDALKNITEEFVNYDRMPGRVRTALEANGLMWFWNFKLRSTKVAVSMIRNNPVHAFLSLGLPGLIAGKVPGSPLFDNAGSVFFQKSRLAYSLGFDQMWRAHLLNPFFKLFD